MYNKNMEYYRKINKWYDRGLEAGLSGKAEIILCFGAFRNAYIRGFEQGQKLKKGRNTAPLRR